MKTFINWLRSIWAAQDKVKHLFAGAIVAAWTAILWPAWAWILPPIFAALAGALKELYDSTGRGTVDRGDFYATLAGGVVVWIAVIVRLLFL